MDNIAGSPVEGENFYGREKVVAHLREILANDDILLLGPRRIGKTSTARAVMATVQNEGWRAVEINVAPCRNERDFLDKLENKLAPELASFSDKAKSAIGDAFGKVSGRIKSVEIAGSVSVELDSGEAEDWTKVASDVLHLIVQADERWMIYVDELPIMLFNFIRDVSSKRRATRAPFSRLVPQRRACAGGCAQSTLASIGFDRSRYPSARAWHG